MAKWRVANRVCLFPHSLFAAHYSLLFENKLAVGIFETLEPRQEGHAEQVLVEHAVWHDQRVDVTNAHATDLDARKMCTRRLGRAVRGRDVGRVICRRRMDTDAGGIAGDQTRLAELAYHEKRYPRTPRADAKPGQLGDPTVLARELLKGAGFNPLELDRVEPAVLLDTFRFVFVQAPDGVVVEIISPSTG